MKTKSSFLVILLAVLAVTPSMASDRSTGEKITVIGLDAMGRATGIEIPAENYRQGLTAGISAVNKAIRPALNKTAAPLKEPVQKTWNLRTIAVGVGLSGQFGLGPIFNVTLSPRLRLVFTNSTKPVYPD